MNQSGQACQMQASPAMKLSPANVRRVVIRLLCAGLIGSKSVLLSILFVVYIIKCNF